MQTISKKTSIEFVVIALCTCKRPHMLKKALHSIEKILVPENIIVEVLVVENDSTEMSREVVEFFQKNSKYEVHYHCEPKRGIAYARNKVLDEACKLGASHLLFFDDDELLSENCLKAHIDYYNLNEEAIIISGPTPSIFEKGVPSYISKHMVFKQKTTKKSGQVKGNCAAGNVFFPLSLVRDYGLKFSEEYVFMGGEDGDFFEKASKLGFTIVQNNEAIIYESVPKARANIKYILKKCYYNGYAGAYGRFKNKNKKRTPYVLKNFVVFAFNCLLVLPALFTGLTNFFNALGISFRTKGKIDGAIRNKPYNFYENIYGE